MTPRGWPVYRLVAPAAELHLSSAGLIAGEDRATRVVRVLDATDHCVVLGSTQPPSDVDQRRLAAVGWHATRRRSGGSAVVVGPGEVVWVDVVVPAGDPLWVEDVGRAGSWLGALWAEALGDAGWEGAAPWTGPFVRNTWSGRVCFAGLAPGEVTIGGRKVLGVAQRRTRAGVLFQCALLVRWAPGELLDVFDLTDAERAAGRRCLADAAVGVGEGSAEQVLGAFLDGIAAL